MPPNTSISDFNDADTTPSVQSPAPADPADYDRNNLQLPAGKDWGDELRHHHDVAVIVPFAGEESFDVQTKTFEQSISSNQVGVIVDGVDALRDASETVDKIHPPSTYTDFESFESYVSRPTTTFMSDLTGGWGIPADRFEVAIRFVTGGGRYRASNLSITALDYRIGWMIEYDGEAFLFSYATIGLPDRVVCTNEVNGITVENEGNPNVLSGIETMMEVLPQLGIEVTGFQKRRNNSLYFTTDQDDPIAFSGSDLTKFNNPVTDLTEYEGTHTIDLFNVDESYEYTWEEGATRHEPGDVIDSGESSSRKFVLGYTKRKNTVQTGIHPQKATVGTKILAKPWYLKIRPDAYDGRIDTRVYGSNSQEIIAEIPYDTPDHPDPDSLDDVRMWNPN